MSRTAEALGVERSNLYRKMKAFGLLKLKRERDDAASA
jgi:transcriptional regulator of acetoin/glycerol metabolism